MMHLTIMRLADTNLLEIQKNHMKQPRARRQQQYAVLSYEETYD